MEVLEPLQNAFIQASVSKLKMKRREETISTFVLTLESHESNTHNQLGLRVTATCEPISGLTRIQCLLLGHMTWVNSSEQIPELLHRSYCCFTSQTRVVIAIRKLRDLLISSGLNSKILQVLAWIKIPEI